MDIRVRMAPSPTGNLHLGTAYTTLFNYLFARKNKGTFILRIEDTDQARSKKEFEANILEGLKWLGISWDEGPYHQIDQLESYRIAAERLVAEGKAYYCFCTREELEQEREEQQKKGLPLIYSGKCRNLSGPEVEKLLMQTKPYAIRFKMPEDRGRITFNDLIHGEIGIESNLLGDMVIMRSNGIPLYNFGVVVDDIDMHITHVLRGEDHISNTPKQIVLFEALGASLPQFAHWPNMLNPDRIGKLSKRTGATSVDEYRQQGFLPEAIINYLSILGWNFPNEKEIMSLSEMEQSFDLKLMRQSPAAFDIVKLEWINGEYIRALSDEELTERLQDFLVDHPDKSKIAPLVPLVKERIKKLSDFVPLTDFIFEEPEYELSLFSKLKIPDDKKALEEVLDKLSKMPKPWNKEEFEKTFQSLASTLNISITDMFQLIRLTVSGQLVTPPLFESLEILGEDKVLERVRLISEKFPNL